MYRYRIDLSYDGSAFAGWQIQPGVTTVQEKLEEALYNLLGRRKVTVIGAGRTDAGVHARSQVAHFDLKEKIDCRKLQKNLNGILKGEVYVHGCYLVKEDFHARYSATMRVYRYLITLRPLPFRKGTHWYVKYPLKLELLQEMAALITGEHDFCRLARSVEEIQNTICKIYYAEWLSGDDELLFEIGGQRFIRSMVRMLVGTMVEVARGRYGLEQFQALLKGQEVAGVTPITAPSHGLTLIKVLYKEEFHEDFYRHC